LDNDQKLNDYLKVTGIINNMCIPQNKRIKLYNALVLPAGYMVVKMGPLKQITAAEIKYMRTTAGYA
jgi:hypothetical protein